MPIRIPSALLLSLLVWLCLTPPCAGSTQSSTPGADRIELRAGDHISLLGGAIAERMQHDGFLESRLQQSLPELDLSVRNLGFSADELSVHQRTAGFGSWDDYLERCGTTVVFAFFGYNESFRGEAGLDAYEGDLRDFVRHTRTQRYDGRQEARVVLFSALGHEDLRDPNLPPVTERNRMIALYNARSAQVAAEEGVPFVDIQSPMALIYDSSEVPLTLNGAFLTTAGNAALAEVIMGSVVGSIPATSQAAADIEELRDAVRQKNLLWFNRYRATDGYNVYGGRSSLAYKNDLSNFTVLQRELERLDVLCQRYDARIWSLAKGEPRPLDTEALPELIPVETNRPGPNPDGSYDFLDGAEAIALMTPAPGMQVNLFASEGQFPELVNPVQMSWDARGRLWVACWSTYPHWKPDLPMNDHLLILEDTDGDGRADSCTSFATDLHNPTGFEFWGGGVLVANAPDLLFLKDTDGDDHADVKEHWLHGLSSADTHHSANSFVIGPDGALYFQEGTFHQSQIETIYGPMRNHDGCVWRFDPRTWRVERYIPYNFANPHGHVFDHWGQDFMTDGTGNVNYYALPFSGFIQHPDKHRAYFPFFNQRSRPCAGTEILSSSMFPAANQGNYLIANVIGFQGIFQYEVEDDGSGFRAEEVEPLVFSSDPRFRPSDIEVGPDGAVYFLDWHNPLIGHMQHHLRDPSRDGSHGRVYRVSYEGAAPLARQAIAGEPIEALLELLKQPDDRVRYRARAELSARDTDRVDVLAHKWMSALDEADPNFEHHLLEGVWLLEQHNRLAGKQLARLSQARDPRARAAAFRAMRQLVASFPALAAPLEAACHDEDARVRLEGVVAMSFLAGPGPAEAALSVLDKPMDRFLEYALGETLRALEPAWRAALLAGQPFASDNPSGLARLLTQLSSEELARVAPSEAVFDELLARHGLEGATYVEAATQLASLRGTRASQELLSAIERADRRVHGHVDHLLTGLFGSLAELGRDAQSALAGELRRLATEGRRPSTRRLATAARIRAEGSIDAAWSEAVASLGGLGDLLDAAPLLREAKLAEAIFPRVLALLDGPPSALIESGAKRGGTVGRYVRIELPGENRTLTLAEVEVLGEGENLAPRGKATQTSVAWNGSAQRALDGNKSGAFGDGGQTHTNEGETNPWWELDLGREAAIDQIAVWNRSEEGGRFASRLDGFTLRVLDGQRRTVFELRDQRAPAQEARFDLSDPALRVRRAAALALGSLEVRQPEAVTALVSRFGEESMRSSVTRALRGIGAEAWPAEAQESLGRQLLTQLENSRHADFASDAGRELLILADELGPRLATPLAERLAYRRSLLGPQLFLLRPLPDALLFDRRELFVVAGRPIELTFDNVDIMPHNLVLTAPGALAKVGMAAEAMAARPDAWERSFVPDLPEVLHTTGLLQPGQRQTMKFDAPTTLGDYPFVCTFPGHWVRMNGVMHVVNEADFARAPAQAEVSSEALATRPFVRNWKLSDLEPDLADVEGASLEAGRAVLEAASCTRCHAVHGEGGTTGPELSEVVTKYERAQLLAQVLDPSATIAEGYESEIFLTVDGEVIAGRVLAETDDFVRILDDPYRADAPVELSKDEIEQRAKSTVSVMPSGVLSTFEHDQILALLAYLESLRDKN